MKGGIIIALYAAMALEAAGFKDRPVKIAFAGDEEGGRWHPFAAKVMAEYARGCAAAFNMETGPVGGMLSSTPCTITRSSGTPSSASSIHLSTDHPFYG